MTVKNQHSRRFFIEQCIAAGKNISENTITSSTCSFNGCLTADFRRTEQYSGGHCSYSVCTIIYNIASRMPNIVSVIKTCIVIGQKTQD